MLGHSGMGVVEEVGPLVTRTKVGDRVIVPGTPECRQCYWCVHGRPDQCAHLVVGQPQIATRASSEPLTSSGGGGTYAEGMRVRESWVFPVETDLPDEQLGMLGCGVTSGMGAVFNAARVEPGSSVAVLGCGHLGLWMIQAARVAGAAQIIAVEERADRRRIAGELGATHLVDPADGDTVEQVQALTGGRGADYALEAAGPATSTELALLLARRAARGRAHRPAEHRRDRELQPVRARAARPRRPQLPERTLRHVARHPPLHRHDGARRGRRGADHRSLYPLEQINDALANSGARTDLTGVIVP